MTKIRTCRRCSVTRVNTLCELQARANHENDPKARRILSQLAQMAEQRGYNLGRRVLTSGLSQEEVRALCWNISSLLTDGDMERVGLKVRKGK